MHSQQVESQDWRVADRLQRPLASSTLLYSLMGEWFKSSSQKAMHFGLSLIWSLFCCSFLIYIVITLKDWNWEKEYWYKTTQLQLASGKRRGRFCLASTWKMVIKCAQGDQAQCPSENHPPLFLLGESPWQRTPGYLPEKPAGTTHSSRSDLSPREQLERQAEFHSSTQDEAWLSCPNSSGTLWSEFEMERNP